MKERVSGQVLYTCTRFSVLKGSIKGAYLVFKGSYLVSWEMAIHLYTLCRRDASAVSSTRCYVVWFAHAQAHTLSFTWTRTHTNKRKHTRSLTLPYTHTHTLWHTYTHSLTHTQSHWLKWRQKTRFTKFKHLHLFFPDSSRLKRSQKEIFALNFYFYFGSSWIKTASRREANICF